MFAAATVLAIAAFAATAAAQDSFVIPRIAKDRALSADPAAAAWQHAAHVAFTSDRYGVAVAGARTEIRGVWSKKYLYLLFVSQFEKMRLKANPSAKKETWGLWDYDVVEVFIGAEANHIGRYKEFEVSPQNEWVDLEVDRDRPGKEVDWEWDSGFESISRVDPATHRWYCAMRIPWKSISAASPRAGSEYRLNLYRIEGSEPNRKYLAWRPVNSPSFHTPSAFGTLRLSK